MIYAIDRSLESDRQLATIPEEDSGDDGPNQINDAPWLAKQVLEIKNKRVFENGYCSYRKRRRPLSVRPDSNQNSGKGHNHQNTPQPLARVRPKTSVDLLRVIGIVERPCNVSQR